MAKETRRKHVRRVKGQFADLLEIANEEPTEPGFREDWNQRRIIAWDGEGINLRGKGKPQNYTLFGCSADIENPLMGKLLNTGQLLNYMCDIAERFPKAVHVAYSFKYDFNMIIQGMPWINKQELNKDNYTVVDGFAACPESYGFRYYVSYTPGKIFKLTRMEKATKKRVSIRIDDVFSFFATSFMNAVESILGSDMNAEDAEVVARGKKERGNNTWDDMPEVLHYWQKEIALMERMMYKFRDVMYGAGFRLTQWYGPGAIASYLIRGKKLASHIQNEPPIAAVHTASKHAYAGGRFELFHIGRYNQPVFGYDINSAYPHALSNAPSLGLEHGEWRYEQRPSAIAEFGVYRIRFRYGAANGFRVYPAMPLFHRDSRGNISYPGAVEGWYWSPEARIAQRLAGKFGHVEILEGWIWDNDGTRPFKFLEEMYVKRQELGKKNVISMPYKLGPNSMYGKFAQRVGFDEKTNKAPKSHCLPLAGWVTSMCRARIYQLMLQIPFDKLIAVETDGIYTTATPEELAADFGDYLGQWEVSEYSEMMYLQNGIYHRRKGNEWLEPKARGLGVGALSLEKLSGYLHMAGPHEFPKLSLETKERFVGLAAAMVGAPELANERHCVWKENPREFVPGARGKRQHVDGCPACKRGNTAWDEPHPLVVFTRAGIADSLMSHPHSLPWENPDPQDTIQSEMMKVIEGDMLLWENV